MEITEPVGLVNPSLFTQIGLFSNVPAQKKQLLKGTSITCRERSEDKANGAQKQESREAGVRILIPTGRDQRSIRVA